MQLNSVYLYPNKVDVFTNSFSDWPVERYQRVYNRNLKIYKGVDNRVDFQVRNSDEKVQSIAGAVIVFSLSNKETGELILQKDCIVQSTTTGKVYVTLSGTDMQRIEAGMYFYCLHSEIRNNIDQDNFTVYSKSPLYIDSQYGVNAIVEVQGDVFSGPTDSIIVKEFRENIDYENYIKPSTFVSSLISGQSMLTNPRSVHTFQFNLSEFYGTISIQGSQSNGASPEIWVTIADIESFGSDILYKNIVGKYNWFRVLYTPKFTGNLALFTVSQNAISFEYSVTIGTGGKGYNIGDVLVLKGRDLNSESPTNDITITVTAVGTEGTITDFVWEGVSQNGFGEFTLSDPKSGAGTLDSIIYR